MDPKFEAVLLKIRKKAVGSFNTVKSIQKILHEIDNWEVRPIVGLVPLGLNYDGKENHAYVYGRPGKEDVVQREWQELKRDEVSSLPSSPQPGKRYILGLEPLHTPKDVGVGLYAEYHPYQGANGFRAEYLLTGQHFDLLPSRSDLERNQPPPVYDLWRWLLEESPLLGQVNEILGTEAHKPAAMRTRDHTGTCPVCFRNIKLDPAQRMVLHGYKRPRYWGGTIGNCDGIRYLPFELSPEGTANYAKKIRKNAETIRVESTKLLSGEQTFVTVGRQQFDSSHPRWSQIVSSAIRNNRAIIEMMEAEAEAYETKVRNWKKQPLPDELNSVQKVASCYLERLS